MSSVATSQETPRNTRSQQPLDPSSSRLPNPDYFLEPSERIRPCLDAEDLDFRLLNAGTVK